MRPLSSISWFRAALVVAVAGSGFSASRLSGAAEALPPFEIFNQAGLVPAAPTNLTVSVPGGPVRLAYQDLLDDLGSRDVATRERAAIRLYTERAGYTYDIARLIDFLRDRSELVRQYVSSVILSEALKHPQVARSLQSYFDLLRSVHQQSADPFVRANCIGLLTLATKDFDGIASIISDAISSGSPGELTNAAIAARFLAPASLDVYARLAGAIESHPPQRLLLADAMLSVATAFRQTDEGYTAARLLDGVTLLRPHAELGRQAGLIEDVAARIQQKANRAFGDPSKPVAPAGPAIALEDIDPAIFAEATTLINGQPRAVASGNAGASTVTFLGADSPFHDGLNVIEHARVRELVWLEGGLLRKFQTPYQNSYAVICAIDDYSFTGGKFARLGDMVANAQDLSRQLIACGFPPAHVLPLFNQEATSTAINALLQEFWQGGKYAECDRLVFYFGGHGDYERREDHAADANADKTGILITADYDAQRPTATGLLMRDLTGRHFENIRSKHVLMLLDSCSSGLALPRFQDNEPGEDTLAKFRNYVVMQTELSRAARNILVAGTGEQKALWVKGGVFTHTLVDGLSGKADYNGDQIVEFEELKLFVRNEVRARAAAAGINQEPKGFKATIYGDGSVLLWQANPTTTPN